MAPTSTLFRRRDQFSGLNDKYMPAARASQNPVNMALTSDRPYDLLGNYAGLRDLSFTQTRLNRYREGFEFYKGNHYANPYEDGEKKPVFNYCATVASKAIEWFCANGWKVTSQKNELVAEILNTVWEGCGRNRLTLKGCLYGVVTGDHFIMVTVITKDSSGADLPRNLWRPSITVMNPGYCHPEFDESNPALLKSIMYQAPKVVNGKVHLFTMYVDATKWITWLDADKTAEDVNVLGRVNIVHVPNFERGQNFFGESDLTPVIPVNTEYNDVALSIRRIIRYHSEPTTIIYGVRLSALEKSAKKVWSGLPETAKVENLSLQSDLTANFTYLERLERQIHELSSTPKIAFDSNGLSVSNTSGLTLQLLYQPLIAKTTRRQATHRPAIQEINRLLIDALAYCGDDLRQYAEDPEAIYDTDVEYSSPLPRDEVAELDSATKKLATGIWSQAEAIRQCADVKDLTQLTIELMADKRAVIAETREKAIATLGGEPNLNVVLLSSCALFGDYTELEVAPNNSLATNDTLE